MNSSAENENFMLLLVITCVNNVRIFIFDSTIPLILSMKTDVDEEGAS